MMNVKIGDLVVRMMGGVIPMTMRVTEIKDGVIHCESADGAADGYTFDQATGAEIDDYLNWGPPPKMTGSVLTVKPQ